MTHYSLLIAHCWLLCYAGGSSILANHTDGSGRYSSLHRSQLLSGTGEIRLTPIATARRGKACDALTTTPGELSLFWQWYSSCRHARHVFQAQLPRSPAMTLFHRMFPPQMGLVFPL